MEDLAKYQNKNYKDVITDLQVVQRVSKDGNPYSAIEITFVNGYKKLMFINSQEQFAWTNAFDTLDTAVQVGLN